MDTVVIIIIDAIQAFPAIILALALLALLGPSRGNVILVIAIAFIPTYARIVRAQVLSVKEHLFVEVEHSLGAGSWRIVLIHILPNILVEVKDKHGHPVRAFKTNQLGQFASETPLMNAAYTIEFEDTAGKNKFEAVEIEAKGEILLPIEIVSHDLRAELRKQLFT